MKNKLHKITKFCIVIDILVAICYFIVYGPIDYARVFWITTSQITGDHRYLGHIFYSNETIKKVMEENNISEFEDLTDTDSIKIGEIEEVNEYTSVYEKQILEREEDALYKRIDFKYKGFNCYLIAIYDPTRVEATYNSKINKGKILTKIVSNNDAILGINGGGYLWSNGYPSGLVVHDGKIIYASGSGAYKTGAITKDGKLIVGKLSKKDVENLDIKEALSFGPILIQNGVPATIKGNGRTGLNPRTVIAQRKDGIMLFLVANGYGSKLSFKGRGGVYEKDLLIILERYGAYNAINMDGGSSTTMVIGKELINDPVDPQQDGQDFIRTAWILK